MKNILFLLITMTFCIENIYSQGNFIDFQSKIVNITLSDDELENLDTYKSFFEFTEYQVLQGFSPINFNHTEEVVLENVAENVTITVRNKMLQITEDGYRYYSDNTIAENSLSEGDDFTSLTAMSTINGLYGKIAFDSISYMIRPLSAERQVMFQLEYEEEFNNCGIENGFIVEEADSVVSGFSPTNCQIDVLAFYSEKALTSLNNSVAAVVDEIELSIFEANIVLTNSQVNSTIRYNLVDVLLDSEHILTENVNKSDPMSFELDISILPQVGNPSSNLSALRDQYGADLVAFFTGNYVHQPPPKTWALAGDNPATNDVNDAAALIRLSKANKNYTTAHELSHLLRCQHIKDQDDEDDTGSNFAFRKRNGFFKRDIFSATYASPRYKIPYHSNPHITIENVEIGDFYDANNSLLVNARGCDVSNFKEQVNVFTAAIDHPIIACGCDPLNVEFKVSGASSAPLNFKLYSSENGVDFVLNSETQESSIDIDLECHATKMKVNYIYLEATDASGYTSVSNTTFVILFPNINPFCWFNFDSEHIENRELPMEVEFANPIESELRIKFRNSHDRLVSLFNSTGVVSQEKYCKNENITVINVENMLSGIYYLKIVDLDTGNFIVKKVVIE